MKTHHIPILSQGLAAVLLAGSVSANAAAFQFTLDISATSAFAGTSAYLAFDLIDGDSQVANSQVTVSNFYTDGSLGAATLNDIPVTPLPSDFTLVDTDFFTEFLQAVTFGNTLSFNLNITQSPTGTGLPDSFAFFLLQGAPASSTDPLRPLFDTSDPTGALFAVDIDGASGDVLYRFAPADPDLGVSWQVTSVPLPSTLWLLGAAGLSGLAARRRGRVRRS